MAYIFYILQLLCPSYQTMGLQAPVEAYEAYYAQQATLEAEKACLARIIYNEARGESLRGKKLVAQVTINRSKSGEFQDSICGVMKAKGAYSFYKPKSKKSLDKERKYPVEYTKIAEDALSGRYEKLLSSKVLYFKNCRVKSKFFDTLKHKMKEGNHCFHEEH